MFKKYLGAAALLTIATQAYAASFDTVTLDPDVPFYWMNNYSGFSGNGGAVTPGLCGRWSSISSARLRTAAFSRTR